MNELKSIEIVIYDKDEEYGLAIGEYISNYSKEYKVTIISSRTELENHVNNEENIVFVVDEYLKLGFTETNKKILYLSEDKNISGNVENTIYKYSSIKLIIHEINSIINKRDNLELNRSSEKSNLISFFSLAGGTGKSSIAITTARFLASGGKNVLYLNLEDIPSTKLFFEYEEDNENFSDFLYYLFYKKNRSIKEIIEKYVFRDDLGVSCFYPQRNLLEINNLKEEEIDLLIDSLKTKSDYDFLICDLSASLTHKNKRVLENADLRFLVSDNENVKNIKYINNKRNEVDDFHIRDSVIIGNRNNSKDNKESIGILNDDKSFEHTEERININMDGIFAKDVRKVSNYIIRMFEK